MHQNRLIYTLPEYQSKLRCNYKKLGLFLKNNETHKIYIFRPIPNCPWLPESRKKYFKKLRNKLETIHKNKHYTFGTLTYSARFYDGESASRQIKHDLDLFFKRLGYHHRKVQYFYVLEMTDNLLPHVHIMFDRFVPWQKLKESWRQVTGNTVTNIRDMPAKDAFWYMCKYLTNAKKQPSYKWNFIFENIDRLWTCSRGFFIATESKSGKYTFLFSIFDPRFATENYFADYENDLMSNEVNYHDAVVIAGFGKLGEMPKVLNAHPDWCFYSTESSGVLDKKSIKVTHKSLQLLLDYYKGA